MVKVPRSSNLAPLPQLGVKGVKRCLRMCARIAIVAKRADGGFTFVCSLAAISCTASTGPFTPMRSFASLAAMSNALEHASARALRIPGRCKMCTMWNSD